MEHPDHTIESRPTDMLLRQYGVNIATMRYRNPETGRRSYAREKPYRQHFVREMVRQRRELMKRGVARYDPARRATL